MSHEGGFSQRRSARDARIALVVCFSEAPQGGNLADHTNSAQRGWLETEDELWSSYRRRERRRRDLLWLLIGLLLFLVGSFTGFPGRVFTCPCG